MIGPAYVRLMAAYNAEMNRRLCAAAATLSDADRRADEGAFWRSIMGTLNHLVWADQMWMSRFAGWPKPSAVQADSAAIMDDFSELRAERERLDRLLEEWAMGVTDDWLAGDMTWWSGSAKRELSRPRAPLLVHLFNHQTHHRGQTHALLTRRGAKTGDTDIFLVVPPEAMAGVSA
jgi:uncharacterized damage-inducible protein DinB